MESASFSIIHQICQHLISPHHLIQLSMLRHTIKGVPWLETTHSKPHADVTGMQTQSVRHNQGHSEALP